MKNVMHLLASFCHRLGRLAERLGEKRYYRDDISARDDLLKSFLKRIQHGEPWNEVIRDKRCLAHSERIPEYAFAYSELKMHQPRDLIDVGCVLNNALFDEFIDARCSVSFLNPATEPIARQRATYYRRPLTEAPEFEYQQVTCLSTLEHIGFDNTRYGIDLKDLNWDWPQAITSIVGSIEQLTKLVSPGGRLLISLPFGQREYVRLPPGDGVRVWQVAHAEHLAQIRKSSILKRADLLLLRLTPRGWEPTDENAEIPPYGSISCGASAVLLLRWVKPGREKVNEVHCI